jgi:hypothetical protein
VKGSAGFDSPLFSAARTSHKSQGTTRTHTSTAAESGRTSIGGCRSCSTVPWWDSRTAARRDDRRDVGIAECVVDVSEPVRIGAGEVSDLIERVFADRHA